MSDIVSLIEKLRAFVSSERELLEHGRQWPTPDEDDELFTLDERLILRWTLGSETLPPDTPQGFVAAFRAAEKRRDLILTLLQELLAKRPDAPVIAPLVTPEVLANDDDGVYLYEPTLWSIDDLARFESEAGAMLIRERMRVEQPPDETDILAIKRTAQSIPGASMTGIVKASGGTYATRLSAVRWMEANGLATWTPTKQKSSRTKRT